MKNDIDTIGRVWYELYKKFRHAPTKEEQIKAGRELIEVHGFDLLQKDLDKLLEE